MFIVRDIVEGYAIIFLIIILRIVIDSITEAILGYTFIIFSSIVILIISKVLYNIIIIVKQLVVIEFII